MFLIVGVGLRITKIAQLCISAMKSNKCRADRAISSLVHIIIKKKKKKKK